MLNVVNSQTIGWTGYCKKLAARCQKCLRKQLRTLGTQRIPVFYLEAWRDAAARLRGSIELLGDEIPEIRLGGACARVRQDTTAIADPVTLSLAANKPLVSRRLQRATSD